MNASACTACAHPERAAIDAALVAGESVRVTASRYGLGRNAMQRHGASHVRRAVREARAKARPSSALVRAVVDAEARQLDAVTALVEAERDHYAQACALYAKAESCGELAVAAGMILKLMQRQDEQRAREAERPALKVPLRQALAMLEAKAAQVRALIAAEGSGEG